MKANSIQPHRGKKRKATTLELLLAELKKIGLSRLNVIGSGNLSTLVTILELEEKDKVLKAMDTEYKQGYTY